MEKHLELSQGYKQLAKDPSASAAPKKGFKISGDALKSVQIPKVRNEKVLQSAVDASLSDKLVPNDIHNALRKDEIEEMVKKEQRRGKSTLKVSNDLQDKVLDASKRGVSDGKTTRNLANSQNFIEKYGSGEGCVKAKSSGEKMRKSRSKCTPDPYKSKYFADDQDSGSLHLPKSYLKSIIMDSDLDEDTDSDADIKKLTKKTNSTVISPRTIFTKSSYDAFNEFESKPQKKNKYEHADQVASSANFNFKSLASNDKNDDSDESGMSYLMKKYLQASDEAARQFSKTDRLSQPTKNSSTQANIGEHSEKRPVRAKKSVPSVSSPKSGSTANTKNIASKFHSFKRS